MDVVKDNMAESREKVDENAAKWGNITAVVENLVRKVNQLEERNGRLEEQLEQMSLHKRMVVVAGGWNGKPLNSVEMFNPATATWSLLQPMNERRQSPSSVIYNNQFLVTGGCSDLGFSQSMEKLSLNDIVQDYQSIPWEYFPAQLPHQLAEHCTEVVNGRLIMIGGYDANVHAHSNKISEIPLVPPYNPEELTTMQQKRYYHGVAMFGEQIVIVGGKKNPFHTPALQSVVMYDITKNECQQLAPLPYPVSEMATVKWGEDDVIIIGGANSEGNALSKVFMYNIKTQRSQMLPDMKYKRKGCVAAVDRDTVIVMGGQDETGQSLRSVESFKFDRNTWQDLPKMREARSMATAVAW